MSRLSSSRLDEWLEVIRPWAVAVEFDLVRRGATVYVDPETATLSWQDDSPQKLTHTVKCSTPEALAEALAEIL